MEQFLKDFFRVLSESITSVWALCTGFTTSLLGYFIPVKDIVHVILFFFILDVIFGYWAARKLRGERFNVKIIWGHTMPRITISIVLIIGAYVWDKTFSQEIVSTYKIIGWFISGVLLFSIAQNGYKITKWGVFPQIEELLGRKIKDSTGMDVKPHNTPENGQANS